MIIPSKQVAGCKIAGGEVLWGGMICECFRMGPEQFPLHTSTGTGGGVAWFDIQPSMMPNMMKHLHRILNALMENHCWVQVKKSGGPRALKAIAAPPFDTDIADDNVTAIKRFFPPHYGRLANQEHAQGLEQNFYPGTKITCADKTLIGMVRFVESNSRELFMDPRSIVGENGGYAHYGVITGQFTLLVEWNGDVQELHKVHIKKVGVKWSHAAAANFVGATKWDVGTQPFQIDAHPRNYPIQGPTWENFMPTKALIAYMPGANFPVTVAIHLTRKGDHVGHDGAPSIIHQHLVRLDIVPAEFDHVFAQPIKTKSGW